MSELISDTYKSQNETLHLDGLFGVSGYKWAPTVAWIVQRYQFLRVLDYGAGQQTLKQSLQGLNNVHIDCYDPAIPELAKLPQPADFVTCTDVLEHIEPECIDEVLDHIRSVANKMVLLVIPTGPAAKFLPDGRNAHLLQKPVDWWLPKLLSRFDIVSLNHQTEDIVFIGTSKSTNSDIVTTRLMEEVGSLSDEKLISIAFDGFTLHISTKPRRITKRIFPRLISIFRLGAKSGFASRKKTGLHVPSITVTRW